MRRAVLRCGPSPNREPGTFQAPPLLASLSHPHLRFAVGSSVNIQEPRRKSRDAKGFKGAERDSIIGVAALRPQSLNFKDDKLFFCSC